MLTKILNRFTGAVIFECECELESEPLRLGFAVRAAVKASISLAGANLAGADLAGADLAGADLAGAYLAGAYLAGASLARANLAGANLAGAYLAGASLARAKGITDDFLLPEGITLGEFKRDIVPQLLTAGGKSLADVLATGCWHCHSWENCPMHAALGIDAGVKS